MDAAGEKAGTLGAASLEALIRQLARDDAGVELDDVRVVRLPEGKDPDEVLRETPAAWGDAIRDARPIVDHLIDTYARVHDLRTPGGRARFVEAVLPTIRHLPNPVLRDAYLGRLRQVSGVEESTLREAARQQAAKEAADPRQNGQNGHNGPDGANRLSVEAILASPDTLRVADILRTITRSEAELLTLTLLRDDAHDRVRTRSDPTACPPSSPASCSARSSWRGRAMSTASGRGSMSPHCSPRWTPNPRARRGRPEGRRRGRYRRLSDRDLAIAISQVVLELEEHDLDERSQFNQHELAEAERGGDRPSVDRLLRERLLLNEQRRSLDRRRDETRLLAKPAVAGR